MTQDYEVKFFVINMDKDKERLDAFAKQMSAQSLDFERHAGPLIDTKNVIFAGNTYPVRAKGYVGVAMAHLLLWEKIAKLDNDYLLCNVFEDDEIIKEDYLLSIKTDIDKIHKPIDFFNLNVIRPMGTEIAPDILKVSDKKIGKKAPNIWLSNYIITPIGARKIIELVSKEVKSLNCNFDRTFVKLIHKHCESINSFVIEPRNKHSIHDEVESSKKEMNRSNPFISLFASIKKLIKR